MDFIEEIEAFLANHSLSPDDFVPVPVGASSPEEAALESERLSPGAGRSFFIVEDRWRSQGESLRLRMLAHAGRFRHVFARNCEARRIDKPSAAAFLKLAHSYGDASCRFRYGLFVRRLTGGNDDCGLEPGTLVAVGEFSSARTMKDGTKSYEWVRYASLPDVRVVGGMGKVLDAFVKEVHPDDVMSYADLEWSDGSAYRSLGFEPEGVKEPVTFAVDPSDWSRTALKPGFEPSSNCLYYRNFGSLKYRKKYY